MLEGVRRGDCDISWISYLRGPYGGIGSFSEILPGLVGEQSACTAHPESSAEVQDVTLMDDDLGPALDSDQVSVRPSSRSA